LDYEEELIDQAFAKVYEQVMPLLELPEIKIWKLRSLVIKCRLNVKKAVLTVRKNVPFYRNQLKIE